MATQDRVLCAWPDRRGAAGVTGRARPRLLPAGGGADRGRETEPLSVDPGPRFVPESFAELSDRLSPAVVNITTTTNVAGSGRRHAARCCRPARRSRSSSATSWSARTASRAGSSARTRSARASSSPTDGYIVTNNHVIESADEISVELYHGGKLEARLVGRDTRTDIALLKVESDEPLPFVEFGDSRHRQGRRLGARHRQPARPGLLGLRRHRLGAQPHAAGQLRRLHPDRRRHQPRQLRRPALRHERAGDRGEHRHPLAQRRLHRHRLRHVGGGGDPGGRPAPRLRRDPPRLARRAHPERRRGRGRSHRPRPRPRARSSPTFPRARRSRRA